MNRCKMRTYCICMGDFHFMPLGNCVLKISTVKSINEILPLFFTFSSDLDTVLYYNLLSDIEFHENCQN